MNIIKLIYNKFYIAAKHASALEVLRKIELIRNEAPTCAAWLLFGNNLESYFPSAFVKVGRFRSPTRIIDDREMHGTFGNQLDGIIGWFKEKLETDIRELKKLKIKGVLISEGQTGRGTAYCLKGS